MQSMSKVRLLGGLVAIVVVILYFSFRKSLYEPADLPAAEGNLESEVSSCRAVDEPSVSPPQRGDLDVTVESGSDLNPSPTVIQAQLVSPEEEQVSETSESSSDPVVLPPSGKSLVIIRSTPQRIR